MPRKAYPGPVDLMGLLASTGILAEIDTDTFKQSVPMETALQDASSLMESLTGRRFIASLATRNYSVPEGNGVLNLGQDLCSDYSQEPNISIVFGSTVLVEDQGYVLGPENSDQYGVPYSYIKFTFPYHFQGPMANRRPIAITGYWGYSLLVPDDVWQAVLQKAAADLMPQVALAVSGGMASWTQNGVTENYSGDFGTPQAAAIDMRALFFSVVAARKRTAII